MAHHALWLAHLHRGEMEEAYQAAVQYRDPTLFLRAMARACCLGHLGRLAEAQVDVADSCGRSPTSPAAGAR